MEHPFEGQAPVLLLLVPFLAGVAGGLAAGPVLPALAGFALLAALLLALFRTPERVTAWAVMVFCGLLSGGRIPLADPHEVAPFLGEEVILRGVVEEAKQADRGFSGIAVSAVIALPDGSRSVRLGRVSFMVWNQAEWIAPGAEIRAQGRLRPLRGRGNPGEFPRELAAVAQRVQYSFFTDAGKMVAVAPPAAAGVEAVFRKARERTRNWIARRAGRSDGALYLMSLTTGDVPPPSHPMVTLLRRTGLAHLLAVSGINVAIFHLLLALLLRAIFFAVRFRQGTPDLNRTASLFALPACWAYSFLTGSPIPALRSAGMLTAGVLLFARCGGRCAGPAWTIMLFTTVVAAPHLVVSPSFLLSYAATFFLIASLGGGGAKKVQNKAQRLVAWGKEAFCASAVAFCGTLPVSVAFFAHVPVTAIVWNLIFGPILGTAGVAGAFLAAVGGAFSIDLLGTPVRLAAKGLDAALAALDVVSGSGWGYFPVPPAGLGAALLFTVAAGWGTAAMRRHGRAAWPAAVGSAAAFLAWIHLPYLALPESKMSLTAVNPIKGASYLLSFPGGGHALIDCGSAAHGDAGARIVAPLLRKRGIRRIDLLIFTHPHEDHFGGARDVLDGFDVGEIWIPDGTAPAAFGEAVSKASRLGLVRGRKAGDRFSKGGVEILVRGAGEAVQGGGPNERCFVLEVRHGGLSVWLPGDVESGPGGFVPLKPEGGRRVVLFLPHHGSPRADPAAWIRAVEPEAVVSQNSNCSVWENLLPSGKFILLENGAFTIRSDGRSWAGEQDQGALLSRLLWRLL